MKLAKLGTVWTASATLFDRNGKRVARCMDTPNAIAKAFLRLPSAEYVKTIESPGIKTRSDYASKMQSWNDAEPYLVLCY